LRVVAIPLVLMAEFTTLLPLELLPSLFISRIFITNNLKSVRAFAHT
jgi:hypothetical protein